MNKHLSLGTPDRYAFVAGRANVSNLGSLGVSFWLLAKVPADMLLTDQISWAASMWPVGRQCGAASTSRGSARRRSSLVSVKFRNAKGYTLIPGPRIPTAEVPQ
jgi:hypothetical protein